MHKLHLQKNFFLLPPLLQKFHRTSPKNLINKILSSQRLLFHTSNPINEKLESKNLSQQNREWSRTLRYPRHTIKHVFIYKSKDAVIIIPHDILSTIDLPREVKRSIEDLFYSSNKIQYVPCQTPNSLSYAAALNHDSNPNLYISYDVENRLFLYISCRDVKVMEELTIDYKVLAELYFDNAESGNVGSKYLNPDAYFQDGA